MLPPPSGSVHVNLRSLLKTWCWLRLTHAIHDVSTIANVLHGPHKYRYIFCVQCPSRCVHVSCTKYKKMSAVLDSRPKDRGFELHRRHCVVSLSKNITPSLVLVQPRKTRPFIIERLLMTRKNQIKQNKSKYKTQVSFCFTFPANVTVNKNTCITWNLKKK